MDGLQIFWAVLVIAAIPIGIILSGILTHETKDDVTNGSIDV